ncbi:MAG: hypothetical protein HDQ96_07560 [Lachnospiraceae bacterium]|nr:hypothetical protein [Lachnospiraceae bacterium]
MKQNRLLSKPIAYTIFGLTGFFFIFCLLTGRELAAEGNILWTAGHTFQILGISFVVGGALGFLICLLFYRWAKSVNTVNMYNEDKRNANGQKDQAFRRISCLLWKRADGKSSWIVFLGTLLFEFLAWLPAFLAYYPAICAYDIPVQTEQIVSGMYIDHHPLAHTLLLKGTMWLGETVFGSVNTGIGCYALFQMLFLAAAFAFGVYCLHRHQVRRIWLFLVQLFCIFYPFHQYMSISVTKDTIFSAFFVLFLSALWEIVDGRKSYVPLFIFAGIGVILFRNNGKYAFLVLLFFILIAVIFGKERRIFWGKVLFLAAGTFLIGNLALSGIFRAVSAGQGDKREMLSLPIQQLSRTMVYHGGVSVMPEDDGTMSDTDRALINDFILEEAYRDYRPDFADPVKSHTNTYVARYRAKDFLSTYLGLFFQYPGDYLNAALAVNAGYLYPGDVSHAYINAQEGQEAGGGYVQTRWDELTLNERGIYKDSKWPGLMKRMEKWTNDNAYLKYPVLKYLFVPGVWFWFYLLLTGWLLINRKFAKCIPLMLVFGYYLTLFLGPTVQLRYLYPVMAAFPFFIVLNASPKEKDAI